MSARNSLLLLVLVFILPACHNSHDPVAEQPQPEHSGIVALAIGDLSDRVGVSAADIEVVKEEKVTWRDGSLGCPRPGMMYTQALVEGNRIMLRAGGVEYAYHSGGDKPPFYCESPLKPASGTSQE